MVRAWAGSTGGGEATTESRAREDTDHVVLGGEHPEETAGGLVQISRHPGGLDGCQVSPGPVHHRGEDGEASELSDPPVEDLPARRADEHREQDGSPAGAENQTGVLVLVGDVEQGGEQQEVEEDDDEGGEPPLHHVLVQQVGYEGQEAQGGHVPQAGGDGCGHVVGVAAEPSGQDDDGHHDEAEDKAGDAGRHHGAGAEQEGVVQIKPLRLRDPGHHHADDGCEKANDDALTLDQDQVTQDHAPASHRPVQLAQVAGGGETRGESHLQVALEAQQGGHHDGHANLGEDRPELDLVQHQPGPHHAQSGHQEAGEHLENNTDFRLHLYYLHISYIHYNQRRIWRHGI